MQLTKHHRARPRCAVLVAVLAAVLAVSMEVGADPTNYQRYVIGERAIGMGGAQTAAVNDPMANLYNPAAMVFTKSTMVSASKAIYSLDFREVKGGYVPVSRYSLYGDDSAIDAVNLSHKNDLTLPSTLAITTRFGKRLPNKGPRRHAFGVAILVPNQDAFTFSPKAIKTRENGQRDTETYRLTENYKQVWTGFSYALRANRELGLGVSAFLVTSSSGRHMTYSRNGEDNEDCSLVNCGFMEFKESDLSIDTVSLLFRIGALWEPHRNWRLGLVISAPTILLGDLKLYKTEGSLSQTAGAALVEGDGDDYTSYYTDKYKLDVTSKEPMSIRAGTAFLWNDQFTVDLDVSVHLPIQYRRIKGNPVRERACPIGGRHCDVVYNENASPDWFDHGIYREIHRKAVANFNIGWELIIKDTWTLRNGLFTDFSAAPRVKPSDHPQQWRINRYGLGFAGGFRAKGYDISLGFTGSLGYGNASVYNPSNDMWVPAEARERSLYIFIAGIQSAAVRTSKTVVKKVQKKTKDRRKKKKGEAGELDGAEVGLEESSKKTEEGTVEPGTESVEEGEVSSGEVSG